MKTENEIRLMLADYPDSLPSDEELMIAVFMGLQPLIVNEYHKIVGWYRDDPKNWFSFPEYKTWNSLMPVVEKIQLFAHVKIENTQCIISVNGTVITWPINGSNIQNVYRAAVEYIKYHNCLIL